MKSLALLAALLLAGCAQMPDDHRPGHVERAAGIATAAVPPPQPMTEEDVVTLARAGAPPEAIVARLQEARTVLRLTATQVVALHGRGVPVAVLDHMLAMERAADAARLAGEGASRDARCAEELRRLDQQWWLRCQMSYPPFPHFPSRRWP